MSGLIEEIKGLEIQRRKLVRERLLQDRERLVQGQERRSQDEKMNSQRSLLVARLKGIRKP